MSFGSYVPEQSPATCVLSPEWGVPFIEPVDAQTKVMPQLVQSSAPGTGWCHVGRLCRTVSALCHVLLSCMIVPIIEVMCCVDGLVDVLVDVNGYTLSLNRCRQTGFQGEAYIVREKGREIGGGRERERKREREF